MPDPRPKHTHKAPSPRFDYNSFTLGIWVSTLIWLILLATYRATIN